MTLLKSVGECSFMSSRSNLSILFTAVFSVAILFHGVVVGQDTSSSESGNKTQAKPSDTTDFKQLKNPVPNTKKSIARGKMIFVRQCAECHGPDGKSLIDVIADATDLTQPKLWFSGTTEGEAFRSIRDGAGVSMPPFKATIRREEDMWHLVNFIRNLWPVAKRPAVQEETKVETGNDDN